MKSLKTTLKAATFTLVTTLAASLAQATNIKDLALECVATYKVHDSKTYYIPAHHRVPDITGATLFFEVLSLAGKDCQKLKDHYGINVVLNQKLGDSQMPSDAVFTGISPNQGKILQTSVSQSFSYESEGGELPLFPLVHNEFASFLGYHGKADTQALYGTPAYASLTDQTKLSVLQKVLTQLDYGKHFRSYEDSNYLELLLNLGVQDLDSQKEYLQSLLLVLRNGGYENYINSSSPAVKIVEKVNQLLFVTKGSKSATALEIYKKMPILFHSQAVKWAFEVTSAPVLNAQEVEEFLSFALETSNDLKKVDQLVQARILLEQYKDAAEIILEFSGQKSHMSKTHYELTEKSKELIQQILQ